MDALGIPSITERQLAELLNVDPATLWRWRQRGEAPPSYKLGRRRLYRRDEIERWVASRREAA